MRCHACGGHMTAIVPDMPFKLDGTRIVIIKNLPVPQCGECGEHAFTDEVMSKIEVALAQVDQKGRARDRLIRCLT